MVEGQCTRFRYLRVQRARAGARVEAQHLVVTYAEGRSGAWSGFSGKVREKTLNCRARRSSLPAANGTIISQRSLSTRKSLITASQPSLSFGWAANNRGKGRTLAALWNIKIFIGASRPLANEMRLCGGRYSPGVVAECSAGERRRQGERAVICALCCKRRWVQKSINTREEVETHVLLPFSWLVVLVARRLPLALFS